VNKLISEKDNHENAVKNEPEAEDIEPKSPVVEKKTSSVSKFSD